MCTMRVFPFISKLDSTEKRIEFLYKSKKKYSQVEFFQVQLQCTVKGATKRQKQLIEFFLAAAWPLTSMTKKIHFFALFVKFLTE